jgi:hypothetical protein
LSGGKSKNRSTGVLAIMLAARSRTSPFRFYHTCCKILCVKWYDFGIIKKRLKTKLI